MGSHYYFERERDRLRCADRDRDRDADRDREADRGVGDRPRRCRLPSEYAGDVRPRLFADPLRLRDRDRDFDRDRPVLPPVVSSFTRTCAVSPCQMGDGSE